MVHSPAYDQIIQGASGVMSITGDSESAPLRVGYPVADTVGGKTAAFAISAALNANPRGSFIDVSMLESVLATMGWVASNDLIAGAEPAANRNENVTSAPSGAFRAQSGSINIAANKDEQWTILAQHLGLEKLCGKPGATKVRPHLPVAEPIPVQIRLSAIKNPTVCRYHTAFEVFWRQVTRTFGR